MNIIRLGLSTLLLAGITRASSNLVLGPQDELAEKCEVEAYDGRNEKVRVRYSTGSTNLSLRSFNTATQEKILSWVADERFEEDVLKVRISKNETEEDVSTEEKFGASKQTTKGSIKTVSYYVIFQNSSDVTLDCVQVELRTFFVQSKGNRNAERKRSRITDTTFSIKAGETIVSTTAGVKIRDLKNDSNNGIPRGETGLGLTSYTKDELEGFCVSVSRKDSNGEPHRKIYEEGRVPDERDWAKYTRQ